MTATQFDKLTFEPMRETHLDQVMAIEKACFSNPWSRVSFLLDIYSQDACCLVVRLEDTVVGYILGWFVLDELHINNIAVHPGYQRRGLGERLLQFLLDRAVELGSRRAVLELRASNKAARRLYEKRGFRQTAVRESYYRRPTENAVLMSRELTPSSGKDPPSLEVRDGVVSKG
jgi:ribosomal-protein-alanine N-acetyltransferase